MAVAADPEVPMVAAKAAAPYVETKLDQLSSHQVPFQLEMLARNPTKFSDQDLNTILQYRYEVPPTRRR